MSMKEEKAQRKYMVIGIRPDWIGGTDRVELHACEGSYEETLGKLAEEGACRRLIAVEVVEDHHGESVW